MDRELIVMIIPKRIFGMAWALYSYELGSICIGVNIDNISAYMSLMHKSVNIMGEIIETWRKSYLTIGQKDCR